MAALDDSQLLTIGIGCIVFGGLLVGLAVYILAFHVNWEAINASRERARALKSTADTYAKAS